MSPRINLPPCRECKHDLPCLTHRCVALALCATGTCPQCGHTTYGLWFDGRCAGCTRVFGAPEYGGEQP